MCVPSRLPYQKIGKYEKCSQFVITWINFSEDDQRKSRFSFNDNLFAVFVFKPGIRACLPSNNSALAPVSRKCRQLFGPEKVFYVCCVCIDDESFNNFDNDTMKLSVKKKNWPVYELQELLLFNRFDFEFAFGPEKLPGLSRNGRLIIFNPLTPDMHTQIL